MRDLSECKAEIRRQIGKKEKKRSRLRKRMFLLFNILIIIIVFPFIPFFIAKIIPYNANIDNHIGTESETMMIVESITNNEYTQETKFINIGDVSSGVYGVIKYLNNDDSSITFSLNKTTDDIIYITLYGYTENVYSKKNTIYCGTTKTVKPNNEIVLIDDAFQIYVDGQLVNELPIDCGEYTIKVVYKKLKEKCERLDHGIYLSGFDCFAIEDINIEGIVPGELTRLYYSYSKVKKIY